MRAIWLRGVLFVFLLSLVSGCGNPLTMAAFLFGPEPKLPALYEPLVTEKDKEKEKELKVAILTYGALDTRPEFLHADREISILTARQLQEMCDYNKELVKLIDPRKVEEFKNSHPQWRQLDPSEIGKALKADAVIVFEIRQLDMYDKNNMQMFRGRAEISITLVRLKDSDGLGALPPREFVMNYPSERKGGYVLADMDTTPQQFKEEFLGVLSRKLAWHFTAHPTSQDYLCE